MKTKFDFIQEIIEGDDNYKTIRYNLDKRMVEIGGEEFRDADLTNLLNLCSMTYPDMKFLKKDVKQGVETYAKMHQYSERGVTKELSEWFSHMKLDSRGLPDKNYKFNNMITFFEYYPEFVKDGKNIFSYNEFTRCIGVDGVNFDDMMIPRFKKLLEPELGLQSNQNVYDAISYVAQNHSYNPFKEALEDLVWDGVPRMDSYFIDNIGVFDTPLNRSMTRKWFYAMMKRLYEPGCFFDNLLIVYDKNQGTGKSKIVERLINSLGIDYGYSLDIDISSDNKETVAQLNQVWVQGIDEMKNFLRKDADEAKQFFSQNKDVARLAYERSAKTYFRHCVFYGCTNVTHFLKDYSSDGIERRYWVMDAEGERHTDVNYWNKKVPYEYCRQVLAEAKYLYDTDKTFNYTSLSDDESEELAVIQDGHKTYKEDTNLKYALARVLNGKYNKEVYYSYEEFFPYASTKYSIDGNVIDIPGSKNLAHVPTEWIANLIKHMDHRQLTPNYIAKLIKKDWKTGNKYYPIAKKNVSVFIRRSDQDDGLFTDDDSK